MIKLMMDKALLLTIFSVLCIIASGLLEIFGFRLRKITLSILIVGMVIFDGCFIYLHKEDKQKDLKEGEKLNYTNFMNPMATVVLLFCIPLTIFVNAFFGKQIGLISKGLTLKQYDSIMKKTSTNKEVKKEEKSTKKKITFKRRIINIWKFMRKKRGKSLVVKKKEFKEEISSNIDN